MIINTFLKQRFGFFGKQISEKYGKKCCRYGLDGKPLTPEAAKKVYNELAPLIKGWRLSPDYLSIYRYFHTESYPSAIQYINDIAQLDS